MKTLLDLYPNLQKKSREEYAGPCPWCGGKDRFIVWPHQGKGGRYLCRQCQQRGDAIDFLRAQGLSYPQASVELGLERETQRRYPRVEEVGFVGVGTALRLKTDKINFSQWIRSATSFIQQCSDHACSSVIAEWDEALYRRQLTKETAKRFGIGWNPRDEYPPCQGWGLAGNKLRIPKGLVIPTRRKVGVVGIRVRCEGNEQGPRYWQVKGSGKQCLVVGGKGVPVVIVESDLDAYLISQEAANRVGVVALGGTNTPADEDTLRYLRAAPRILIATDYDEPDGDKVGAGQIAFHRLKQQFPHAECFPPVKGKDPCEMHTRGIPINLWLDCALSKFPSVEALKLPQGYRGSLESLQKYLSQFPQLVPCPLTSPQWQWRYRIDCGKCSGHIHCIKDFPINNGFLQEGAE